MKGHLEVTDPNPRAGQGLTSVAQGLILGSFHHLQGCPASLGAGREGLMEERLSKGELALAPAAAWSLGDTRRWRGCRSGGACPQLCPLLWLKDLLPEVQAGRSGGLQPLRAGTCRVKADAEHSTSRRRSAASARGVDVMGSTGRPPPPQFASACSRVLKGYLRVFRCV